MSHPACCPGCRAPVPADTLKCPTCFRNVNQATWEGEL